MALVSEAGNGRVRNTTIKQLEPKATTNEYLEAPKERSNRPLLRSIAITTAMLLRRGHGQDNGMFCMIA